MIRDLFRGTVAALVSGLAVFGLATAKRAYSLRLPSGTPASGWMGWTAHAHFIGRSDARYVIVEFSDFTCPYCKAAISTLSAARATYGRDLAIAYINVPSADRQPFSVAAAKAAICADEQGAFEAYHNYLFANQDSIGVTRWVDVARRVGLRDTTVFVDCLVQPRTAGRLTRELEVARQARVTRTPSFVIDGRMYAGPGRKLASLLENRLTNSRVP